MTHTSPRQKLHIKLTCSLRSILPQFRLKVTYNPNQRLCISLKFNISKKYQFETSQFLWQVLCSDMFVTEMFDTTLSIKCESNAYLSFNVVICTCDAIIFVMDTWKLAACVVYIVIWLWIFPRKKRNVGLNRPCAIKRYSQPTCCTQGIRMYQFYQS